MPYGIGESDKGDIGSVLYILPPAFLDILSHHDAMQVLIDEALQLTLDDEAWEQELQRRRRIETKLRQRR